LVCRRPGPPDVLTLEEVATPAVPKDGLLVRVRASSANVADLFALTGMGRMGAMRRPEVIGRDFAGTVESVGRTEAGLRPGDDVFGATRGAMAEYVAVRADGAVAAKPAGASFDEAAAVPLAATTALQAVRDHGRVRPGQHVLVNGASGGVGTFTVQIAAAFGAQVTAVCSTRNAELARSLGAAHVIDYTREDFTQGDRRYDVLLDIAGSRSWREYRRIMRRDGRFVAVGAKTPSHILTVRLASLGASQTYAFFIARLNGHDLNVLREMMDAGKLRPVIDRRFELAQASAAFAYMKEGHAQGKVVIQL
jgi:NADPH:quinone reductase-like Zn-dependent oxidoreductase